MVVGAQLIASLTSDHALSEKIIQLPQRFSDALTCDWSAWSGGFAAARRCVRNWRGFGLGPAREIALKITETMRLPTLSYSAAEVRHGPLACASAETPLLVLRQNDGSSAMVDAFGVADLRSNATLNCSIVGDPSGTHRRMHSNCDHHLRLNSARGCRFGSPRQSAGTEARPIKASTIADDPSFCLNTRSGVSALAQASGPCLTSAAL